MATRVPFATANEDVAYREAYERQKSDCSLRSFENMEPEGEISGTLRDID